MKPLPKSVDQFEDEIRREVTNYWRDREDKFKEIIRLKHEALRMCEKAMEFCLICGSQRPRFHERGCPLKKALKK